MSPLPPLRPCSPVHMALPLLTSGHMFGVKLMPETSGLV